jgi:mannonate dehydratase
MCRPEETDRGFPHEYRFSEGSTHLGDAPGLGVEIDEKLAEEFPHHRAYLPVNRKGDYTIHSWQEEIRH